MVKYTVSNGKVVIEGRYTNRGKVRVKSRECPLDFGQSFATRNRETTDKEYIEWQIGYDRLVGDEKKPTILEELEFIGANGKRKNPYELSEIIFYLQQAGLLKDGDLYKLLEDVKSNTFFFDEEYQISVHKAGRTNLEGLVFEQTYIKLPTFVYEHEGIITEVSIQKQQYATGVQPMVYVSIPVVILDNASELIGVKAKSESRFILSIDEKNSLYFLDIFRIFSMCSRAHQHDVIEILKLLV